MKKHVSLILLILACSLCTLPVTTNSAQTGNAQPAIAGFVDSLQVEGTTLTVRGWAGARDSGQNVVAIAIWLADSLVYEGSFQKSERHDVVKSTGRKDWQKSGWVVSAVLPKKHARGKFPIEVQAKLQNGQLSRLELNPMIAKIIVNTENKYAVDNGSALKQQVNQLATDNKLKLRTFLVLLAILLCAAFSKAEVCAEWVSGKINCVVGPNIFFGATLMATFLVLLGLGLTGSSLGLGAKMTPFVKSDELLVWGQNQSIRSDEWLVGTPYNIAQYNHRPPLPIINKNLGQDGQNMLVVTGAPVAHVSAIAKPITWGFFFFDLKRALSWYWFSQSSRAYLPFGA